MYRDFGYFTVHLNRYHLSNFALGFDYYELYETTTTQLQAAVWQLNFLFFNITITRWHRWI